MSTTTPSPPAKPAALPAAGRVILISGCPGAGKGIQCRKLVEHFGFIHISTGDIFREAVTKRTELGLLADSYIKRGLFVPDDVVINLVKARIREPDAIAKGVLLDGFPRTPHQAAVIAQHVDVERFIIIQASEDVCTARVIQRRIDPVTNTIYNLTTMPPPTTDIEKRLIRRDYDIDEKIIRARIKTYYATLSSILSHFRGKIQAVNGFATPEEVFAEFNYRIKEPLLLATAPNTGADAADIVPPANPPSTAAPIADEHLCVVCTVNPADYISIPCGHQCGCEDCLKDMKDKSMPCPICRTKINMIVKVYKSGFVDSSPPVPPVSGKAGGSGGAATAIANDSKPKKEKKLLPPLPPVAVDDGGWGEDILYDSESTRLPDASLTIKSLTDLNLSVVSISCPDVVVREPLDVCCVIDVSGSMGSVAEHEGDDGSMVSDGFTILDIVKHAVKTVAGMLNENDRITVVSFSSGAETVFPLEEMTSSARARLHTALERIDADGSTNLWSGLERGMDVLRTTTTKSSRKRSLMLLTDGQPSVTPPKGHEAELKKYFEKHSGFDVQINTFGFSYGLDSSLLLNLAVEGNGTFSFLPVAGVVGTYFVDSLANSICNYAQKGTLHLVPKNGATFAGPVCGNLVSQDMSWGRVVELGPLLSGVSRDVVFPLNIPADKVNDGSYLEATIVWKNTDGSEKRVSADANVATNLTTSTTCSPATIAAILRSELVTTSIQAINDASNSKGQAASKSILAMSGKIDSFVSQLLASAEYKHDKDVELVSSLHSDCAGRMTKSLNAKDRYQRWGQHYLRAITRAHQIQHCTNMLDAGLQRYSGPMFAELCEEGEDIYLKLPPPVARNIYATTNSSSTSYNSNSSNNSRQQQSVSPPSPVMTTYYGGGGGGGCFSATSTAIVVGSDGEEIKTPIANVRAGDRVVVSVGGDAIGPLTTAIVRCVVEIDNGDKELISYPSGLQITPSHPIRINGKWIRPRDHEEEEGTSRKVQCSLVYNLVLDSSHILLVNGVECVTWGHNIRGSDVIEHSFYGTNDVICALASLPGFLEGYVSIKRSHSWGSKGISNRKALINDSSGLGVDNVHTKLVFNNKAEKCA